MVSILCIGKSLTNLIFKNRPSVHSTNEKLFKNALNLLVSLTVGYELIWAIGTGKVANVEIVQATVRQIRFFSKVDDKIVKNAILYDDQSTLKT